MSVEKRKELLNKLYDAALIGMLAKKVANMPLSTPESLKGTFKSSLAIGLSCMGVKWAQDKKYLPVDPFKSGEFCSIWVNTNVINGF